MMHFLAFFGQVDAGILVDAGRQVVDQRTSTMWVNSILTPGVIGGMVAATMAIAAIVIGSGEVRRRRVAKAAWYAYHIVEDAKGEMADTLAKNPSLANAMDKTTAFLKAIDDWMIANKWRSLDENEKASAVMQAKALNGVTAVAAETVAKAATLGK